VKQQAELPGMPAAVEQKRCGHCGKTKPLSEFHRNKNSRDGHTNQCKECAIAKTRAWYKDNKERAKTTNKEYRDSHKAEIAARDKRYREANREQVLAKKAEYREAHREELAAYSRRYYAEHPEERREYGKQYRSEHHEETLERNRQYKEQHPNAFKEWYAEHREERIEYTRAWHAEHEEHDREYAKTYREEHRAEHAADENRRRARKAELPGDFDNADFEWLVQFYGACPCCGEEFTEENPATIDHIIPITWEGCTHTLDNIQPLCRSCNCSKGDRHATDYRDRIREFMMRPDLHGPENFMEVYRQAASVPLSGLDVTEGAQ